MNHINIVKQPNWILDSASENTLNKNYLENNMDNYRMASWNIIEPGLKSYLSQDISQAKVLWQEALNLNKFNPFLLRTVNSYCPELLDYRLSRLPINFGKKRIAIVIPGELRLAEQSQLFFNRLSKISDIFICTSAKFKSVAEKISYAHKFTIIEQESLLPVQSMHQWQKLYYALKMIEREEKLSLKKYTHIIKLRTDFFHIDPTLLINELLDSDNLIGSSDKVFGGKRDLMMLFQGFYEGMLGWFDDKENDYWPINVKQILKSDDNIKWYGMNFPTEIIGNPKNVSELRSILSNEEEEMSIKLQSYQKQNITNNAYCKFFIGHPRFASEVCYARYVNMLALKVNSSKGMKGFLRSDRLPK